MAIGFTDLEKADDTIPREMATETLRWMEDTKNRVLCGPGVSGEFKVNVALRQGSALSPLLFIAVVELISRKIGTKDKILQKLLYAEDLAIMADGKADLLEQLVECKDMFSRHGQRVSLEKM